MYFFGDEAAARAPLEEGLALSRELGYRMGIVEALGGLGQIALAQGDDAVAVPLLEESLAHARAMGNTYEVSSSLNYLGMAAHHRGDYQRATTLYAESLVLRRELGDRRGSAALISNLGDVALRQGDIKRAVALSLESLAIFQELGWKQGIGHIGLLFFAEVACAIGQPERAVRLLGAEQVLREEVGYQIFPTVRADYEQAVAAARAQLGEEAFAAAWAAGRALTLEQALAYALEGTEADSVASLATAAPQ